MREYRNDDLIVYWYPERCSHPGICLRSLPRVFDVHRRPWVDINAAPAEEIIQTIDKCPSGALRYALPEGSRVDPDRAVGTGSVDYEKRNPPAVTIKVCKNGPFLVEGPVQVQEADGKPILAGGKLTLCRCGLTHNAPFCDGTHFREGWHPDGK